MRPNPATAEVNVGGLTVEAPTAAEQLKATPIKSDKKKKEEEESATAYVFQISSADGWTLSVAYLEFKSSRDIRCISYSPTTPVPLHRLARALRMSVNHDAPTELDWVELSQARPRAESKHSNLYKATVAELDEAAGVNVARTLGAEVKVGTRGELLDETSNRRGYACAIFSAGDMITPVTCYVLTRVLPLVNGQGSIT